MNFTESSHHDLFGAALGLWLSKSTGLRAAYLPTGVPRRIATALVQAANQARPGIGEAETTYCLLIDSASQDAELDLPVITASDTIQYRLEHRLLVVVGREPELASVRGSYKPLLDKSFPSGQGAPAFAVLAEHILAVALNAADVISGVPANAIDVLAQTLADARSAHEVARQGAKPWNAYWFDHVSIALRNLVEALTEQRRNSPDVDVADMLVKLIPASFALPQRGLGTPSVTSFDPRKYKDALDRFWSEEETVKVSVQQLNNASLAQGHPHTLNSMDWNGFDQTLAAEDNPLIAFAKHSLDSALTVSAFAGLTYKQFLNPNAQLASTEVLRLFAEQDANNRGLAISEDPDAGPDLVGMTLIFDNDKPIGLQSDTVRIRIPLRVPLDHETAARSTASFTVSQKSVAWTGHWEVTAGELWAVGRFQQPIKRLPHRVPGRLLTIRIALSSSDVLSGLVDNSLSRQVLLSITELPGIWIQKVSGDGVPNGRPDYIGPETINKEGYCDELSASWTTEDSAAKHRLILWGGRPKMPSGTSQVLPLYNRDEFYLATLKVSDLDEIEIRDFLFELRTVENVSTDYSPLVAAINNNRISSDSATPEMTSSLAGRYEQMLTENLNSESWMRGLGHVVLPTDRDEISVSDSQWCDSHSVLMPPDLVAAWSGVFGGAVSPELLDSPETVAFRRAFLDLKCGDAMNIDTTGKSSGATFQWPSRTSWRHLWEEGRPVLDNYLEAHTALVKKAVELEDPFGVLWAAFPFSMSGWTTATSAQCMAIYISPLHPIRLAWLAAVEATFSSATNPASLSGQIEGWNFPIAGPCGMPQGFAIAVPCDPGDHQLFTGWALLVTAQLQVPQPLQAPRRFGRDLLPGNATSGLNSPATAAALRDFHKMQPHVSTMTVDLASTVETQRLPEIDAAIVKAAEEWTTKGKAKLPGGIRVLDSQNRVGDIPRLAVGRLLERSDGVPFSWMRYRHEIGSTQRCNVRLLQDSGVALYAEEATRRGRENRGVVGQIPLRRFELLDKNSVANGQSFSTPALRSEPESAFAKCLQAIESPVSPPAITARIQNAMLVDPRADWTVSGESLIAPSAMATMVQRHSGGSQMLWEWRPPFLGTDRKVPPLARRPYVSVAKVPKSFVEYLNHLLSDVQNPELHKSEATQLLATLGARGIGLSSLLARGGTHATAALGFYLTLRLLDFVTTESSDDFVLPIDACDTFLKSLAGQGDKSSSGQKADLLAIRLTGDEVVVVPIEIKFRTVEDLGSSTLPGASSAKFKEATKQLSVTKQVLKKLQIRYESECSDPDSADAALWTNTMATLVETAMKLSPGTGGQLDSAAERFSKVLAGDLKLRVGKPVVAYFCQGASVSNSDAYATHTDMTSTHDATDVFTFGAHVCDARVAFEAVHEPDSAVVASWRSLMEWAFSKDESEGGISPTAIAPISPAGPPDDFDSPSNPAAASQRPIDTRTTSAESTYRASSSTSDRGFPEGGYGLKAEGIRFPVGKILGSMGDAYADYWPSNTELNQLNIGVVGDLGTGKTQLLKAIILQLRSKAEEVGNPPLSLLIFDYKKDFQDPDFLEAVGGTVLLPHQIPLNLFEIEHPFTRQKAYRAASRFGDVLGRIYGGIGPKQRQRLNDVVVDLFEGNGGEAPTVGQVYDKYLESSQSPDALSAILQSFYYNEIFSEDRSKLESFADLISNRVLVVAVDSFGTDQQMKNSLVTLFLNFYYEFMLRSRKWPYIGANPQLRALNSFLLIDEAVNIMEYRFPVLQQLLLQGREYGFGVILCSQYLSHFRQSDINYGQPLLTWFIHKVPNVKLGELHQLGLTDLPETVASQIPTLKQHQALYSSLGFRGRFIAGIPYYELTRKRS